MPSTATYAYVAAVTAAVGLSVGAFYAMSPSGDFAECGGGLATGAASIGGPFTLVSETGETVTEADVIDKPTLLYFGYTFCPDVCPIDAAVMAQAGSILEERGHEVNRVFISFDPQRDTPEVLADFTDNLDEEMLGLTGSKEQIDAAVKAYRAYYNVVEGSGDDEFYLIDHTSFTYLMDPVEGLLTIFRTGDAPDAIADAAACYLDALPSA
ncbi:MAG: SCO family protein [Pseudomonadota bacterium]